MKISEEARELAGKLIPHTTSVYNVELIQQAFDAHDAAKWQPIEKYTGDGGVDLLLWAECYDSQFIGHLVEGTWTVNDFDEVYPTHWMPLPKPPKEQV